MIPKVALCLAVIAVKIFTFEAFNSKDFSHGLMINGTCPNITTSFGNATDSSVSGSFSLMTSSFYLTFFRLMVSGMCSMQT